MTKKEYTPAIPIERLIEDQEHHISEVISCLVRSSNCQTLTKLISGLIDLKIEAQLRQIEAQLRQLPWKD
jgi:hypothetical protein